jgi:hypothetical protein
MGKRRFSRKKTQGGDSSPVIVNVNAKPAEENNPNASTPNDIYIFSSERISTQSNTDMNYQEVGIIHVTESSAINMARNMVTNVYNAVGAQGFDNTIFDSARNQALTKMNQQLTEDHKVSNLRMEVSSDPNLVFVHLYGTLLKRMEVPTVEEPTEEIPAEMAPAAATAEEVTTPTTEVSTPTTQMENASQMTPTTQMENASQMTPTTQMTPASQMTPTTQMTPASQMTPTTQMTEPAPVQNPVSVAK